MFGLGGVFVELLRDTTIRLIPVDRFEAMRMMQELRLGQLLNGYRQYEPVDKNVLAFILLKVLMLAEYYPSIKEIDINPIFSYSNGALIVDARIILERKF